MRRVVGPDETLLDRPGPEQWIHACYFILTVFTIVGFGDMSALTTLELCYVSIVMLVGTIVHSILVSEMINIAIAVDEFGKKQEKCRRRSSGFTRSAPTSTRGCSEASKLG